MGLLFYGPGFVDSTYDPEGTGSRRRQWRMQAGGGPMKQEVRRADAKADDHAEL